MLGHKSEKIGLDLIKASKKKSKGLRLVRIKSILQNKFESVLILMYINITLNNVKYFQCNELCFS